MAREDDVRRIGPGGRAKGLADDQIRALVARYDERQQATPEQGVAALFGRDGERPTPPRPSLADQMRDRPMLDRFVRPIPENLTDPETGNAVPVNSSPGLIQFASPTGINLPGAVRQIPGVLAKGLGISKARAGANLEAVAQAANNLPVSTQKFGDALLRAGELKDASAYTPRAVTNLLRRSTTPGAADMTFKEGRDVYSIISRLSADEFNKLSGPMKRQVALIAKGMNEALTDTAGSVGKADQYASGMREFARAAKAAKVGKWAAATGGGAAAGYVGLGGLNNLINGGRP